MQANRKRFVGGNWKCNNTQAKTKELVENVINKLNFDENKTGFIRVFLILTY